MTNINLNQLPKTNVRPKKRLGRGYGSGKGGHTSGRGQKGQKTRSKLPLYFEGTAMRKSLIRRMPMLRGKLRFKPRGDKPIILNLKDLQSLPKGTTVDIASLIKLKVLPPAAKDLSVKILGDGDLKVALNVALPISKAAAAKVIKAGGKVVEARKQAKPAAKKQVAKKPPKKTPAKK
jgi:large subunit ribosomal protein L15